MTLGGVHQLYDVSANVNIPTVDACETSKIVNLRVLKTQKCSTDIRSWQKFFSSNAFYLRKLHKK